MNDDELNKKMADARKRGVSEDIIQARVKEIKSQTSPQATAQIQQQPEAPKSNFLMEMGKSLLSPLKSPAADAWDVGKYVLGGGEKAFGQQYSNPFRNEEDLKKTRDKENPLGVIKDVAKSSAGVASYAVPVGGSIRSAVGAGVTSGALSGFGGSEDGKEIEGALTGGVAGGVTGGALKGVTNVLSKGGKVAEGVGKGVQEKIVNPKVTPSPFAADDEKAITEGLRKMGFTGTAQQQREMMPKVFNDLTNQIKTKLSSSKKGIGTADLVTKINNILDESLTYDDAIPAMVKTKDKFMNQLIAKANQGEKGTQIPAKAIFELKQSLGRQLKPAFKRLDRGGTLSEKEEVAMTFWNSLDDLITEIEPDVKRLTKMQSTLYDASPGLQQSAQKNPTLELFGTKIPMANDMLQGAQSMAGRGSEVIGNKLSGAADAVSNNGIPISTSVAGNLAAEQYSTDDSNNSQSNNPFHSESVPPLDTTSQDMIEITNSKTGETKMVSKAELGQYGIAEEQETDDVGIAEIFKNKDKVLKLIAADMKETGGKNVPEIQKMYEIATKEDEKEKTPKLSEGDKKFALAEQEADKAYQLIASGSVTSGKTANVTSKFSEFFGTQDTNTTNFKQQIATARTAARNALLGANMSDKELESYLDAVFDYSNEPEILKTKLKGFVDSMKSYRENIAGGVPLEQTVQ
jgi:hypothetical protein